jgi:hypothetical protein
VQIKDNGTHAILPVAAHVGCAVDHGQMPVMWLRHSDGKMRRDGSHAALLQRHHAVDERGGLHNAHGLAANVERRVPARIRGPCRTTGDNRQWVTPDRKPDRLGRQDKSRKVRPVGWGSKPQQLNQSRTPCEDATQLAIFLIEPFLLRIWQPIAAAMAKPANLFARDVPLYARCAQRDLVAAIARPESGR